MTKERELMRRAIDDLELQVGRAIDEIRAFLASEPEAKPIGLLHPNGRFELTGDELPLHLAFPVKLYTKPEQSRKPMTHEEIIQGVTVDTSDDFHAGYWAGIRFAEKHHQIGINKSDPDSIDLQSQCRGDKL